jgi:SAM-dependent methyltransferase
MSCHGELARSKPAVSQLTLFYLCVAAGGALGGVFCTSVATSLFPKFWEYHIGLLACMAFTLLAYYRDSSSPFAAGRPRWAWATLLMAFLGVGGVLAVDATSEFEEDAEVVARARNFYGVLTVYEMKDETGTFYALDHGRIRHGLQYQDPGRRLKPTSYYHPNTGVGLALRHHPKRGSNGVPGHSLKIGVVGLGAGSLAVYGKSGDSVRFYEINPEAVRMAETEFSYLQDSPAEVDLVIGDARLQLERELAAGQVQGFDVLILDAFASDAVPMHLLTHQAFEIYSKHLNPGGILAFHVSNFYVDLRGLIHGTAKRLGYESLWIDWHPKDEAKSATDLFASFEWNTWILLTHNREFLQNAEVRKRVTPWEKYSKADIVWNDDYASLLQVLR